MDLHMLRLGILEGPSCVLCNKVSNLLRFDTECHFLRVFWFDITHTYVLSTHTHTHKDTHHTQGPTSRLTHRYKYILAPPVMCSEQLFVFH